MKESYTKMLNKEPTLRLRPREAEKVSLDIPKDTLASMQRIAASRDMSLRGLLKLYIGQGLRQDLSRFYADHVLNSTAEVLARHLHDDDQISAIMQDLQVGSLAQVS